jgi:hypothetical protein
MEAGRGGSRAGGKAMISEVVRVESEVTRSRRSEYGRRAAISPSKLRAW